MRPYRIVLPARSRPAAGILLLFLAACATAPSLPPASGGEPTTRPSILYDSIAALQKIPAGNPEYAAAQTRIAQAEKQLKAEVDALLQKAADAVVRGNLREAGEIYQTASRTDPRRKDTREATARLGHALPLVDRHEKLRQEKAARGDLTGALAEDDIILTMLPGYGPAASDRQATAARLRQMADERYRDGQRLLQGGDEKGARRAMFQTLLLDPAHQGARDYFAAAQAGSRPAAPAETDFFVYTLQKGETISLLAERYYGDRFKFPLIATFNNLSDPTKVEVGQKIRIPLLEGMTAPGDTSPQPAPPPVVLAPPPDHNQVMIDQARSYLEAKAYTESIEEAKKVLGDAPGHRAAREILLEAYYRQGQDQIEKRAFDKAIDSFQRVRELVPDYKEAVELQARARREHVDELYKEGITLYRDQKLEQALQKWDEVLKIDPAHDGAKKYREKALQLLEKLKTMEKK